MTVNFLPQCTRLVNCKLSISSAWNNSAEISPPSMIVFLQLQSLTLYGVSDFGSFAILLKLLVLPALKALSLLYYIEEPIQSTLLALIARSGCSLESFKTIAPETCGNALGNIASFLEASLWKLSIPHQSSISVSTIERMISGELVPYLEAMRCAVNSVPRLTYLLQIQKSGKSPGARESYEGIYCAVALNPKITQIAKCRCRGRTKEIKGVISVLGGKEEEIFEHKTTYALSTFYPMAYNYLPSNTAAVCIYHH
jgi:hypothetical protein